MLTRRIDGLAGSVRPLEVPLLDPQLRGHLGIVAAHLLDQALGPLRYDLKRVAEQKVGERASSTMA